jgi:hypothetical protein
MNLHRTILLFALFGLVCAHAQKYKETDWKPALADGGAPECPDHVGSRTNYSPVVSNGSTQIQIVGASRRTQDKGCQYKAELLLSGKVNQRLPLTFATAKDVGYEVADFSPDGESILFVANYAQEPPDLDFRDVSLAIMPLDRGRISFVNAWNVFGWKQCDATVEPQGFTTDGRALILVRPPTWQGHERPACVNDWGLYATDLKNPPVRLPDDSKVSRFGKVITEEIQACKTDPDIVSACFKIHGRLSAYNGGPSLRMWRVGTKRMLGILDEFPLPQDFPDTNLWDQEAWGDFEVCPFTQEKPGYMQMVCVESAKNMLIKERK